MPSTTTNLLLKVWNNLSDKFNHTELQQNWEAIDVHDHTGGGKGIQIATGALGNFAVTNAKIANDAVDASKIVSGAVGTTELADNAVQATNILDGAILPAKISTVFGSQLGVNQGGVTRTGYAEVLTDQATVGPNASPVDLTTAGPQVTVTVPASGLVMVFAQADLKSSNGNTVTLFLYEDGVSMGQIMGTSSTSFGTRYTLVNNTSGTLSKMGSSFLVFPTPAGSHTYKLMYRSEFATTANYQSRKLWVRAFSTA